MDMQMHIYYIKAANTIKDKEAIKLRGCMGGLYW